MILGDFGLAKRLEKNSRNLTLSDKPLGAIFTMAPEMKRSPAGSDGKKADVYSLAKTLWMFLTLNDTGFEGQYNFLDKTHSLRFDDKYQGVHLVEIEELLCDSTNNDPDKRPDMRTFLETLKKWQTVFRNTELSQKSDWRFITKIIFGESSPQRAAFDKLSDIYNILNIISKSPTFNHMFFAGKGGSDLVAVERAKEPGCLYLVLQPHGVLVAKPKILYYCGFLDTRWNYFLLELEDLPIAVGDDITQHMEFVVEDFPGHYTSAKDAIYGVYDYDSGEKLPDGFKIVNRCIHEKLLITMKMGPYNYILSTYDGRHANCSTDVFFTYISTLSSAFSSLRTILRSDEKALAIISKVDNPFNRNTAPTHTTATKRNSLPRPVEFIKNEFPNWDFSNCLSEGGKNQGTMRFYFALRCESCIIDVYEMIDNRSTNELTNSRDRNLFIFSDGKLQSCTNDKAKIFNNNFYYLSERNAATQVRNSLNEKLRKLCVGYQMDDIECPVGFTIIPLRALPPTHLFSRDELKRVMRAADDRKSNRLVIDEFGYIRIISGEEEYMTFPVAHEMYMPRKNYVGKYSSLSHLEDVYCYMLFAWLRHLKEDQHIFCNDYTFPIDIANVLKEIQTYY